ncbi:penicillin acylase family protein [uncultured Tenacibaculum sp.]|uniref:penicillin acylase family protein n=1 Tax=uncultured Tenacibaculum sp. TaxID=174713 RepID=UPI00262865B1|nr:penicillin acylase family protein [uncultured Tenacibaculum sp.]
MKVLKKLFFFLFIIIVLLVVGYFIAGSYFKPKYNGELKLSGLQDKVIVFYDDNGVPHINAQNQKDAYKVFGYVHAQDRLWQMELMRRIAAGRLSEVFGKDLVRTDKFFGSLGIEEAAENTIKNLDANSKAYQLATAYLEGINEFIKEGTTPLEFHLVGIEKEAYTLKDMYNVFGYMAFSFAAAHKTDPLLNEIKEKLGNDYLAELGIPTEKGQLIKNARKPAIQSQMTAEINAIYEKLPVSSFIGSNSWVLGPKKTANGKVIFANDPHINFSQPSVWYQSHIKTPDFELYGFNLALTPFPLLGHNKDYAYGLTMLENDDVDFYIEQDHPENSEQYNTADGFKNYKTYSKTIKVKKSTDVTYQVRVSQHGPIMNDIIEQVKDKRPIAMQWIYTHLPNQLLDVCYEMSHATNLSEFKKGVSKIHAPGLNVMYGDAKDNIAWFGAAKLYQYRDSLNTKVYLDGTSGKDEILNYLNFGENPQATNPDWGYVYSANNQPDTVAGKLYPGYYLPEDRAKRIVSLIENKDKFTKYDVSIMMNNVNSVVVKEVINSAFQSISDSELTTEEKEAATILKSWDGNYDKESLAATVYTRFIYQFLQNTFEDEIGEKAFIQLLDGAPLQKKLIAVQMHKNNSLWWDNVNTKEVKEDKKVILTNAFKTSVAFLKKQLGNDINSWKWKRVLSVEHEHPIGKAGGVLRKFFNVGPFETNGGNEVINNHIFKLDSTGIYKVVAGPSTRRVIDFYDVENSISILPTGQSGNRFSPYYKDQAQKYLEGNYIPMLLNQQEIEKSKNKLEFLPK